MATAPLESVYVQMRNMTRGCYPVPDNRGPKVYELTEDESLNGIVPENCDCETESEETESEDKD